VEKVNFNNNKKGKESKNEEEEWGSDLEKIFSCEETKTNKKICPEKEIFWVLFLLSLVFLRLEPGIESSQITPT